MISTIIYLLLLCHASTYAAIHPRVVTNTSKAGLAWGNDPSVDISQFTSTGKVSWYYTWYPIGIDSRLEFVPMLWGAGQTSVFSSSIQHTLSSGDVHAVLGMNEPQERGQSNMTPQQGADLWKTYLEPLRTRGIRLGSPAPSSAPSGLTWLQDFFTACAGACTVDFIALHWYDVNATAFQVYLEHFHDTFQKPIWVTEWACQNNNDLNAQCTREDVVRFLNQTQTYMDKTPWVERYAWFGALRDLQGINQLNRLMDQQGRINDLGRQYIGAGNDSVPGRAAARRLSWLSWLVVLAGNIFLLATNRM